MARTGIARPVKIGGHMDNPTVDSVLIRKKFCWPYGKPVGLREWDGKNHPVTIIKDSKMVRIEPDPFTYDMETEVLKRTGK